MLDEKDRAATQTWCRDPERHALYVAGYTAPIELGEPERARLVLNSCDPSKLYTKNPHTTSEHVRHLLSDPTLVEVVQRFCGASLKLWRTAFFQKEQGSNEIGWHHDKHFQHGDEAVNFNEIGNHFSVLIALTPMVFDEGLLEVIPGSHCSLGELNRDTRPYHLRPPEAHIMKELPAQLVARRRGVPIPAGCFIVFHSALIHRSLAKTSAGNRLGLAVRLSRPNQVIPPALADPIDILEYPIETEAN